MSEVSFIKSFLNSLDSKPVKLPADYVIDPERVPLRAPYVLPKLTSPHPAMPKRTANQRAAPGSSKSITVHVKSARNPVLEFSVPNAPLSTTSVEDLKDAVQARIAADAAGSKVPLEKIKILYKRKPVSGKTIAEVVADEPGMLAGGKAVEFGVMVMGGALVVEKQQQENQEQEQQQPTPAATEAAASGDGVLGTEAFWDDLQGFLEQKVGDKGEAERLRGLFRGAWGASR
ncbi:cell-cycle control medial ring component [Aspergillus taichungensis]|uniref:Cell-cycle control medial ring component n=1 Tax=Aspergillus taichungensis TaxID=482145 RepID=A0A2J5I6G1_9EURO|nr:cell-cycle control medial ring component [Aspergillus taichungensis]